MKHTPQQLFPWRRLAVCGSVVGLLVAAPTIASFSIDVFSPTIAIPIAPHAPDDILSSSFLYGWPMPAEDAAGPGPFLELPAVAPGFGGLELDAISWEVWNVTTPFAFPLAIYFSVDRFAVGLPGGEVYAQAAIGEAAGDVFEGVTYLYPIIPPPLGPMPLPFGAPSRAPFGPGKNEWAPPVLLCPPGPPSAESGGDHRLLSLISTPPPVPGMLIDDLDALDCYTLDGMLYSSLTPATGLPMPAAVLPGDILVSPFGPYVLYAPAFTLGLDFVAPPGLDDVDALQVYDMDGVPTSASPDVDFALFSLRAGSPTLAFTGLSPGDVFITDFTGSFDIFAYGVELGLAPMDELDALTLGFPAPVAKCADQDGDGDVDVSDFAVFASCFGGALLPPAAACPPGANCDFDNDGDVDAADFAIFAGCFGGAGNPVPAGCALGC
jgi:hypothetical protein